MKKPFLTRLFVYGVAASAAIALNFMINNTEIPASNLDRTGVPADQQAIELTEIFNHVSDVHYKEPTVEELQDRARELADPEQTVGHTLNRVLQSLDPHSRYSPPVHFEQQMIQMSGESSFVGVGVSIEDAGDYIRVMEVHDGPAKRAGVQAGDLITHVNGQSAKGWELAEIAENLRGEEGTSVSMTVERDGSSITMDVQRERVVVEVSPVRTKQIGDNIGYVHLATFGQENASEAVREAVLEHRANMGDDFQGLILDLRGNLGGLVSETVEIADDFLDEGLITNFGKRPDGIANQRYYADDGDILDGLPIVVLTDEMSASASELLSGALQDHDRATIMGSRSFGKGSAQGMYELTNGGAINITTALYFLPSGRSIQGVGITPDIHVITDDAPDRSITEANRANTIANPNGASAEFQSASSCEAHIDVDVSDVGPELLDRAGEPDEALICAVAFLNETDEHVEFKQAANQQLRKLSQ